MNSVPQKIRIDYEELLELMYIKHHTRTSMARAIGTTTSNLSRYLRLGIELPVSMILSISEVLQIENEKIPYFFMTQTKIKKAS